MSFWSCACLELRDQGARRLRVPHWPTDAAVPASFAPNSKARVLRIAAGRANVARAGRGIGRDRPSRVRGNFSDPFV